ncbi:MULTISPECIES: hypothetical protein [Clostridium]|uniref:hypothetical protein n=1 Tax=Clostridium TaxID=1485 RepID=UPI000826B607|nr:MULTISPECIES: hypothetical protein [Clostridium]PJI09272.1 hypothetical protein CUB90_15920 [Clostridium sp. CT7]
MKNEELRMKDDFLPLCSGKSTFYKRTFPLVGMKVVISFEIFHSGTEKNSHSFLILNFFVLL